MLSRNSSPWCSEVLRRAALQKCINAIKTMLNAVPLPARQATQQRRSRYRSGMDDRLWPRLCENSAWYNRTQNFKACGHAQSKKTQEFVRRLSVNYVFSWPRRNASFLRRGQEFLMSDFRRGCFSPPCAREYVLLSLAFLINRNNAAALATARRSQSLRGRPAGEACLPKDCKAPAP
jgi:hypothetical protein